MTLRAKDRARADASADLANRISALIDAHPVGSTGDLRRIVLVLRNSSELDEGLLAHRVPDVAVGRVLSLALRRASGRRWIWVCPSKRDEMRRIADQCEQEPSRENVAAAIHAAREMRAKSLLDAALLIAGAVGTRDDLYPAVPNADGFRNFADILSLVQDSIVAVVKAAIIAAEGDNKVLGEFVEDIVEILSEMNEQPRVSLLR